MDRKLKALKKIDVKKGKGLELGPLYSPVLLKSEAKVYYVDHMSTPGLRKKYSGHPFSLDGIVDVDYVVGKLSLTEAVASKKFDYVIASHVIEHIPDVVGWFKEVASVLKSGGILSLVIPDKRYSFDVSRDVSRPSAVIGAYLDGLKKASSEMVYDSAVEYREVTTAEAGWSDIPWSYKIPSKWNVSEAYRRALLNLDPNEYVDCHCYVFTPESFFTILRSLVTHELFDYEVVYYSETARNDLEFYVSLRKVKKRDSKKQLASIPKIKRPLRIEELERKVELLNHEIISMKNSKSWRVTKPIRIANSLLKRS